MRRKRCRECNQRKPLAQFQRHNGGVCSKCVRDKQRRDRPTADPVVEPIKVGDRVGVRNCGLLIGRIKKIDVVESKRGNMTKLYTVSVTTSSYEGHSFGIVQPRPRLKNENKTPKPGYR